MACIDISTGSGRGVVEREGQRAVMGEDKDPVTGLTPQDRDAIRSSWALVSKDAQGNGTALMIKFFQEYPHNQDSFHEFRGLSGAELRANSALQEHAMRVITALTTIVDSIHDSHVLVSVLHKTIDSHVARGIRVMQFKELFAVFAGVLAEGLGEAFTPGMEEAWGRAARAILSVVEARVQDQAASNTPAPQSSPST